MSSDDDTYSLNVQHGIKIEPMQTFIAMSDACLRHVDDEPTLRMLRGWNSKLGITATPHQQLTDTLTIRYA